MSAAVVPSFVLQPLPGWWRRRTTVQSTVQPNAGSTGTAEHLVEERGVQFTPGTAFYRGESAQGRDLAVLAAAVHRRQCGQLRVLDVMAGSGMRGARYLQQAQADLVWCNDYDRRNATALVYNLVSALQHGSGSSGSNDGSQEAGSNDGSNGSSTDCMQARRGGSIQAQAQQWMDEAELLHYAGFRGNVQQWGGGTSGDSDGSAGLEQLQHQQQQQRGAPQQVDQHQQPLDQPQLQQPPGQQQQHQQCRVTHVEARRLLAAAYLREDYFDLVDVDGFGSDTSWLPGAIEAVQFGGMLYLTSTDGLSSGGKRPQRSLAAYGAYLRALPHSNEQGLRMLIGAAVREGAARGVTLRPLFSLYSYHGPVFRVMLRASRGSDSLDLKQYGFVGHCYRHGENTRVPWRGLSQAWCRCKPAAGAAAAAAAAGSATSHPTPLVLSGPMWTGPLHDTVFVSSMAGLAAEWGWTGSAVPRDSPYVARHSKNNRQRPLEVLLDMLVAESAPKLPPWYTCVDTLAMHLSSTPSRDKLITALQKRGFVACLCHVEHRALRTNATTQQVLQVAVEDCGYQYRLDCMPGVPGVLLRRHNLGHDDDKDDCSSSSDGDAEASSSSSSSSGDSSGTSSE